VNDLPLDGGDEHAISLLDDIDGVIVDPLKFKRKLRIGEDAYAVLRLKNGLQQIWGVGGGVAAMIGLGAAATPIGWVIAAAVVSGGAYYGVTRLFQRQSGALVDTIPRFINTPIDLLGVRLLDLMGALALRVAEIDGAVAPEEVETIARHFVEEWGYDAAYVSRALEILQANVERPWAKVIAKSLAEFQAANPDCNGEAMQSELLAFLREVIEADGVLDEREDLAISAIAAVFRNENAISLRRIGNALSDVGDALSDVGDLAMSAVDELKKALTPLLPRGKADA
jgi:hypothetical protein